jgi:hypothetical protein
MKKKIFTLTCCFLAASLGLSAQDIPVPVLSDVNNWHYETNASNTQSVEVVDVSTIPEGIGLQTDNVFKHISNDIEWGAWWWCAAISFQDASVAITETTKALKFKVFSETLTKYYIVVKTSTEQAIITLENYPVEPGKWNTIEVDLSALIGQDIGKFELVPQLPNQTVYFYPYFENLAPKQIVDDVVGPLVEMDETLFAFGSNNASASTISVVDTAGLNVPVEISDKVFKIHANDIEDWQFWWNLSISLNDAIVVPENEDVVLVAQVKSPNNQFILMQFADDNTILNTAYNWGTRHLVPDQWNEIIMDYIPPHRGWTFLKRIEMAAFVGNIDAYVYFYWATKSTTSIRDLVQPRNNIKITGNRIIVEGAMDIKQYSVSGKLINISKTGFVPAVKGLNIIVADGVAYKIFYDGK